MSDIYSNQRPPEEYEEVTLRLSKSIISMIDSLASENSVTAEEVIVTLLGSVNLRLLQRSAQSASSYARRTRDDIDG